MIVRKFIGDYEYKNRYKTGIYRIYHVDKPEISYVGSSQRQFCYRWRNHEYLLRNNKHYNKYLQRTINKYGLDGLKIEILELCDKEFCISFERWWNYWLGNTYNTASIQKSFMQGVKMSEEAKLKLSRRFKGKISHNRLYEVSKYDLKGNYICTYKSIMEASRDTGGNRAHIAECAKGNLRKTSGFQWRFEKITSGIESIRRVKPKNNLLKVKAINVTTKEEFIFDSVTIGAETLKVNKSSIRNCLSPNQPTKTAGGYKWEYLK